MARLQQIAGGAFGAGGTIGARQFLDQPGQSRFTQPSVLFGLGTGALASVLWFTGLDSVTPLADEFWGSHALSSLPAGLFFLAFPKQASKTTVQQVQEALKMDGSGPKAPAGNGSASTQRTTVRRGTSDRRSSSA